MSGIQSNSGGEYVPSPRPNPRLRPEGAAYAERNRGTMERWFDYSDTLNSDGGAAPKTNDAVTDNGHHQGDGDGGVSKVTEQYAQLSMGRTPAEEAREYAMRNRGQLDHVINNYRATAEEAPAYLPVVAGDPAAKEASSSSDTSPSGSRSPPASPSRDSARQHTLHQESEGSIVDRMRTILTWEEARPAPRIRPGEGESIAAKNTSDSMFDIMRTAESSGSVGGSVSGKVGSAHDSPAKAAAAVSAAPAGTTSHGLHHSQESALLAQTESAGAQPRARPGEGMRNYERAHNQSEMAAIMRGEGDGGCSRGPRNSRHLQRSELW